MSAAARRLTVVGPDQEAPEIPAELIRFATLPKERQDLLLNVNGLLDEIAYGTVVLVMQDGKTIQIETSEKLRLR